MKIVHHNIQGLSGKLDAFQIFIDSESPDILCLSEHHLRDFEFDTVSLHGFSRVSGFCRKTLRKGGVCIFSKSSLEVEEIDVSRFCLEGTCELAAAKFKLASEPLLVITVYKPLPFSASIHEHEIFFECLSECLDKVMGPEFNTIIVGDFNIDLSVSNVRVDKLIHIMSSHGLDNRIKSFTREFKNSKSLLDHIYTDLTDADLDCSVVITALSDHHAQVANFRLSNPVITECPEYFLGRSFSDENVQLFCWLLSKESWTDVYKAKTMEEKMCHFESSFRFYFDQVFPEKKIKIRKKVSCNKIVLSSEQLRLREMVIHWYYTTKDLDNSDERRQHYLSLKRQYKSSVRFSKSLRVRDMIQKSSNKNKTIWNIVNESRGKANRLSGSPRRLINSQGNEISDPRVLANMLNDFFIDVSGSFLPSDFPLQSSCEYHGSAVSSFFLLPVSESEVREIIRSLKPKSSAGHDNVSSILLKKCCEFLVEPLVDLINCSFETGVFPEFLKLSVVKPLHKKGRTDVLDNFRPISVTSTFSKVFERAVFRRLWSFIDLEKVLFRNQFGFVKGKSTVNAVFTLIDGVARALDSGNSVSGVFFDLRKAFDMVPHERLLHKLEYIGVRGVSNMWFSSYLNERRQVVEMIINESNTRKRCFSSVQKVKAGVPQGSILGPLLFLVYINDLWSCVVDANLCLFADDTSIVVEKQTREAMEVCTYVESNGIVQWIRENGLVINSDKTTLIDFSIIPKKNINLGIWVDDVKVFSEDTVRFLGVLIDRHLTFSAHIEMVARRICSGIFVLRRLSNFVNSEVLMMAYYSLVFPFLSYAVVIWGSECTRTQQIFVLQKKALRIIAGLCPRQSCRPVFKQLKLLTFPCIFIFQSLIFLKQNHSIFQSLLPHSKHDLRTKNKLNIPHHSTSFFKRHTYCSATSLFNALPSVLRSERDFETFKRCLKTFLIEKCFYSVKDFLNHKE